LNFLEALWRTAATATRGATRAAAGAAQVAAGLLQPTAVSSLNGPVTTMRRFSAVRVRRTVVDDVCRKFGVTINDVALAAITEGFRTVLLRRGEQLPADSLRVLVPVSVRSSDAVDGLDNRFSIMLPCLPVEQKDPVQQLRAVHRRLNRAKQGGQRQAGSIFVAATNYIPFMVSAWVFRLLTRMPQRGVVALATNVPGPRHPLRMMGHTVVRLLPIPPIAMQLRTGIAVLSYADDLVFGITADYDAAPDVEQLAEGIETAVARLEALSQDSVLLFAK
jgi:diacylglycerol O-acyltransferase